MKERVELLDIAVDVASTKDASDATIEYIEQEGSKVVYFFNSETLLLLQGNESWKQSVDECELVLPGSVNVDNSIDDALGHKRDSFYFERYMDSIYDHIVEMGYDAMLVASSETQFQTVQNNIHEKRPYLNLSGLYFTEQQESLEHMVNEINSLAPDVLLISCAEQTQLELLCQYRTHMNAGLVLYLGNHLYHKAVEEEEVPNGIKKWNLDNVYKWFRKKGRFKQMMNNIKMKIHLKKKS